LFCALREGHGKVAKLSIERGAETSNSIDGDSSLAELALLYGLWDIFELPADKANVDLDKLQVDGKLY